MSNVFSLNRNKKIKKNPGFTLVELLVVIGVLAILLTVTLIAVNPSRQFSLTNNTKRSADVNAILNAINQYMTDNHGALPAGLNTTAKTIESTGGIDLCASLIPAYIAALPVDPLTPNGAPVTPSQCANYNTNYVVQQIAPSNRISVSAPAAELGATVSVIR